MPYVLKLADLIRRYRIVEGTMNLMSFGFGCLVVYVLWRHSPPSFGRFKYLLINVTASEIVYMIFAFYVVQPIPMFPTYACICYGPISYFGADGCLYSMISFAFMLGYPLVSLLICFVYRYALVAPEWIGHILSKNVVLVSTFAFMLSTVSVPAITLWFAHTNVENVKEELLRTRPEWGPELSDYVYFGSGDSIVAYVFMGSLVFLLVCNTIIALIFTYLIHHELHKHRTIMSKNTLQMHRTLINILLAQTVIPMIFICFPISFVVYLVITQNINDALMHISHAPLAMYPFINSCLFLRFSPPHRRAVINLFWTVAPFKQPETKMFSIKTTTNGRTSNSRI